MNRGKHAKNDLISRLKLECMCTNIVCVACEARERLEHLEHETTQQQAIIRRQALHIIQNQQ